MSDTHETPDAVVGKMDEPQVNEAEKCPVHGRAPEPVEGGGNRAGGRRS